MIRTFWRHSVVDGIMAFTYVMLKSLIPVVLAQLLLQFQQPLAPGGTNSTSLSAEDASAVSATSSELPIIKRSISDGLRDFRNNFGEYENLGVFSLVSDIENGNGNPNSLSGGDSKNDTGKPNAHFTPLEPWKNMTSVSENSEPDFFTMIWNDYYWLASIVVISTVIGCLIGHHLDLRQRLLGARMRIACSSAIYRKTLRLSKKTAGQTPAGYLINLLSNDVGRLDYGFVFMHYIWIMPIQSVLMCYIIWTKIGIAALVGVVGLLLKTIPVQTALSRLSSVLRMKIATRTDKRVGIMNELIQGIQVIKMYAWEKPFQAVVAEARRKEVKQIRYASYLRCFYLSTMVFTERSTLFITVAAAALLGSNVTADVVFSMAQFYNILQLVAAIFYPLAVSFGAEALVSIKRVQEYLLMEEHDEKVKGLTQKTDEFIIKSDEKAVLMKNVTATWELNRTNTLNNIDLELPQGKLCAIIGPVGAGKSSLLQLLLGELPILDGSVIVNGTTSFASQEPWLFTGTVRNNILFGEEYDKKRYHEVTKCCALLDDFNQLPNRDQTVVGERGASLSGGQRARISLARAVYKPASIYLLDDPLSAVDAHVGRHLFDEVIGPKGRLAKHKATRILVTHQVHFLTEADWIIIVDNGIILRQGTYKELANSELDFAKLLERSDDENPEDSTSLKEDVYEEDDIPYIDGVKGYRPLVKRSDSTSSGSVTKSVINFADIQRNDSKHMINILQISVEQNIGEDENAEDQAEGYVSLRVWKKYLSAGGNAVWLSFMLFIMILSQVVCSGCDYFVNIWTQQEFLRKNNLPTLFSLNDGLLIYLLLILGVVAMTIYRGYLFFITCMRSSKNLHNKMFGSILRAGMRFFDTNPSGRILNRFSRDMGSIDEFLPRVMMDFIQITLVMCGILVVICIVNPVLLLALSGAIVLFYLLIRIYLQPSQDLKRLDGIAKSPVFSHLSSSLSGISTIRSRGLQDTLMKEFDILQDVHSAVWHLTLSVNTALGLWFDLVSCSFLAAVSFSFILIHENTNSGNVGLAISQCMILTGMVQYGIRQAAETMQQMTSVERILQYTDLPSESSSPQKPVKGWPSRGKVVFNKMTLRYDPEGSPVLKGLDFTIQPGWKVGIVGRTGAGKSSLIGALFRLAHIEGKIFIDDVETGSIDLQELRSKISIIPQDPVLFSATIRYNLDPFEAYSDADIWRALEEVELKQSIPGLDFMITERGSNFSVGQRQLVCLARAILRNNKVLVLDEATANVDPQTDALIQQTIRNKFKECTVLTVAHRLHTVMDSDRILVMEAGIAMEFDIPYILLQNSNGIFKNMVDATGSDADALKKVAQDTYKQIMAKSEVL
ncbi:probable multidrug resistance-associated protein lethal(2)03659 isoform X3 [Hermetia illucens]|nr:probable multidrug resistance-associated protein lethal(2)03659 isoform X3 [Hermetia illucens]